MCKDAAKPKPMLPMLLIGIGGFALLVAIYFWATSTDQEIPTMEKPTPLVEMPEPEPVVEPEPEPEPEPVVEPEPEPVVEAPPVDTSDSAVKTSVLSLADYEAAATLLVDEALLQRFVVTAVNLAKGDIATNHQLLQPPTQSFRVYQQAGKEWIDPASYKRYTPYVDAIESMEPEKLIALYEMYKPRLNQIHDEIDDPDKEFTPVLKDAIEHLLETPSVPVPIEVYTDSVMYKYRDERLEALSEPQKQLLRTGPENMRRIKAKLREVLELL